MATATVYKVVTLFNDGRLCSRVAVGEYTVFYRIGVEVRPSLSGSLLFAFKSEAHARAFLARVNDHKVEIWEAEAEDPKPYDHVNVPMLAHDFSAFWNIYHHGFRWDRYFSCQLTPNGTVVCECLTLRRKVFSV